MNDKKEISQLDLMRLRKNISASISRMAELFGLDSKNAADSIRKMEGGGKEISGPIKKNIEFMRQGVELGQFAEALPKFLICSDAESKINLDWVFHTRYPRFLAFVQEKEIEKLYRVNYSEKKWLTLALWIDEPVKNDSDSSYEYLIQAADALNAYANET